MFFIIVESFVFEKIEKLGLLRSAKLGKFLFHRSLICFALFTLHFILNNRLF